MFNRRKKYISANGYSPQFNKAVGSFVYSVNLLVLIFVFVKLWPEGLNIVGFGVAAGMAFALTKIELVLTGFWKY